MADQKQVGRWQQRLQLGDRVEEVGLLEHWALRLALVEARAAPGRYLRVR